MSKIQIIREYRKVFLGMFMNMWLSQAEALNQCILGFSFNHYNKYKPELHLDCHNECGCKLMLSVRILECSLGTGIYNMTGFLGQEGVEKPQECQQSLRGWTSWERLTLLLICCFQ